MNTPAAKQRRHYKKNKKMLNNYTDTHRAFFQMPGQAMHTCLYLQDWELNSGLYV